MRKRGNRASGRRTSAAVKLMGLGGALALIPTLIGQSRHAAAFVQVRPLALMMLMAGFLLWLFQRISHTHSRTDTDQPAPKKQIPWSATVFEMIEWRRFEALVEAMVRQAGYLTKSQSHGADEGVDIWVYRTTEPNKPVSLIQCKH